LQGDVKFAEVLEMMGAKVTWTETSVTVTGPPREPFGRTHLKAIDVNMNKMTDVAMTLSVVALFADGPTAIRDGKTLSTLTACLFCVRNIAHKRWFLLLSTKLLFFISGFLESEGDREDGRDPDCDPTWL